MALNLELFLIYHYFINNKSFKILIGISMIYAILVTLLASDIYWIVKTDICTFPLKLKLTNRIRMIFNHDLVKNVYFDDFNDSLVVVKEYVANKNCENLSKNECQQLYLHSKRYKVTELKNLVLCPDNGNFTLLLNGSADLLQNISFDSLTEIILVRMLKASEGWPVPHYLGHCGNVLFEEYVGNTLANIDLSSWRTRLHIAFQLLEIASKFSFSHPLYGFYFTDVTPDNIAFRKNMEGVLIDLDNVIIVDKTAKSLLAKPHSSEIFPDDNGFIFSTQDICQHVFSDHNFYAVCEHIFHKSTILGEGLLENIPHFYDVDGGIKKLVQECAFPRNSSSRFIAANLLQEKLKSKLVKSAGTDGVVVIDDDYKHERKIFGQVVCSFRYGREEDEVMGLNFQKDLFLASEQVYPQNEKNVELSRLQERLMKKLGPNAIPFTFILPTSAPASVTLQPGSEDEGEPCGVQYFVKMFAGESETDRTHKRSTVALGIRKIQYAPSKQGRQPCTIVRKDFMLSPGELELEVTLDKQLYHHNEKIAVNICIRNNSNKIVKKIKAMVQQGVDVVLFQNGQYRTSVAGIETQEGCPILPGSNLQKVIYLVPVLESNKDRRGIALDGQLKRQDTNLASSTLLASPDSRDAFGIIVSYSVKVKLYLGALGGELSAELPLVLMHPKPSNKNFTVKADSQADIETFKNETMDQEGCDAE